jgi:hypothetical protein
MVTSFGELGCQKVVYTQQVELNLPSNKQKAPLGRKRKPEVFLLLYVTMLLPVLVSL